uniref:Uncharacterized protein n=1 Tax=viral metagenome TaxID=1070528 RepID=A0A6M3JVK0_9ZZZZ
MSLQLTITGHFALVQMQSNVEFEVALDEQFAYVVQHTGVDTSNNDDAQSALPAILSTATGAVGNLAEKDAKFALMDGKSVEIGPGISMLYIDGDSGADAMLAFSRKGELTRAW